MGKSDREIMPSALSHTEVTSSFFLLGKSIPQGTREYRESLNSHSSSLQCCCFRWLL